MANGIVVQARDFGPLNDAGQREGGFEHCEVVADVLLGTCAEGYELSAVAPVRFFRTEPVRVEC
jgi:hypothetical protein